MIETIIMLPQSHYTNTILIQKHGLNLPMHHFPTQQLMDILAKHLILFTMLANCMLQVRLGHLVIIMANHFLITLMQNMILHQILGRSSLFLQIGFLEVDKM